MSNITDYIHEKGNRTFNEAPFTDVDNLVFCYLVYYDFTGIVPGFRKDSLKSISLKEAMKLYFSIHGMSQGNVVPHLLHAAGKSRRFGAARLSAFLSPVIEKRHTQFAAVHFEFGEHLHYIAYRGIDSSLYGWREAFQMSYKLTRAQRQAAVYLRSVMYTVLKKDPEAKFIIGGHSKGGSLALFASSMCGSFRREHILRIYSNDGPGISAFKKLKENYQKISERVRKIVPEYSVIGMIFEKDFPSLIVKSTAKGLQQHEPMSWIVDGDHFRAAKRIAAQSRRINRALEKWISRIDMRDREVFVSELFDAIENTGRKIKEAAEEVPEKVKKRHKKKKQPGTIKRLRMILADTSPETRRTIRKLLWAFIK